MGDVGGDRGQVGGRGPRVNTDGDGVVVDNRGMDGRFGRMNGMDTVPDTHYPDRAAKAEQGLAPNTRSL